MSNIVDISVKPLTYYSCNDEAAFFEWLDKIACVKEYKGAGDTVFISVDSDAMDETALRDLLALFFRYSIDMKQFTAFDYDKFSHWFRNKKSYWFQSVFGA